MIHQLKIEPQFFDDVVSGKKTFEIRKNDRDFKVGDFLALDEYADNKFSGRCCLVEALYILYGGTKSLPLGYVCMSIRPCYIGRWKDRPEIYDFEKIMRIPVYGEEEFKEG